MPPPVPHPDVVRLLERFAARAVPTYDLLSVPQARAVLEGVVRLQAEPAEVAEVRDVLLPGAAGRLPARVYRPDPSQPRPLVAYLHGGGFVLGSLAASDRPCRRLAHDSGCVVVAVDYRLAPETAFPGPLEDCVRAVQWLRTHGAELGGDGRLVLLGDSAGGNLVAATTQAMRAAGGPPADHQVLVYPTLAPARGSAFASYAENADGPFMTRREMEWFWDHYLPDPAHGSDPRAAPLLAEDLSGLPPATVFVSELDVLRDEGLAYAARLRSSGVPVRTHVFPGAAHGFWWMDAAMSQAAELTAELVGVVRG